MATVSNNFITADSKSPSSSNIKKAIRINLADNFSEVRGFGQPIPIALAKKMARDYCDSYIKIEKIISFIEKNQDGIFDMIKGNEERLSQFEALKSMMLPENHVVSGVFGKEIILQTLAQKNCEGIRYIIAKDDNQKMTVILAGVKEAENEKEEDNFVAKIVDGTSVNVRKSEILPSANYFRAVAANSPSQSEDPSVPEVHAASLTVKELRSEFDLKFTGTSAGFEDVLFGEF